MVAPIKMILLVTSGICFVIGATNFMSGESRVRIISIGLASFVASMIF